MTLRVRDAILAIGGKYRRVGRMPCPPKGHDDCFPTPSGKTESRSAVLFNQITPFAMCSSVILLRYRQASPDSIRIGEFV